ncbi:putative 2OG-Fe(II) oxygenase [Novosphingobium sp.]|uniref:putative 2OG-Fe(II) oxygenase n=1 Tax=Novosphingobium sp. TaxID=1874826 RepID=UPI002610112A|nr:putative 2OG-Fe(II) oxygenase [Novosphingobium sp.]
MSAEALRWRDQARVLRGAQRMVEADQAITRARALAPADPLIAFLHAQSRYELGHPAAALFAEVCRLWPDNLDALRNRALAEASEGRPERARDLLAAALAEKPGWAEGHRVFAALEWVAGNTAGFDASYGRAITAEPGNPALWLGWFAAVAQLRDWPRAEAVLDRAEAALGPSRPLIEARLFLATERGDEDEAERLLALTADWPQPFVRIAAIRHALRRGQPERALAIALPLAQADPCSPLAGQAWPYVSTCWRLLGDERAGWLDGAPPFVRDAEVGLTAVELAGLADLLRGLHAFQLPYAEQSVRGGTQTDRSVLLRHEPLLQRAREALLAAVRDYVAGLPPPDPTHPLLARPRARLLIGGSWSVRLAAGGFNVAHSHPRGWISSAFYVSLPDPAALGAAPAGHFQFGAPPVELGVELAPYATIAPQVGHVVLFPSTLWHGTVPFAAGERLNLAFDVVPG